MSKSAQFPLMNWLPDAMAGPTPVSALIHAATMVAAGVYLLSRVFFLLTAEAMTIIAFIGSVSALIGAISAMAQNDLKRVLAYSTISQLGFMVIGVGVGAPNAALFHLITHAFFKAGLFLCAGAIIHVVHEGQKIKGIHFDVQDMRNLGNLRKNHPLIFFAYTACMLGLAGVPLFSGFLSKDAIILASFQWSVKGLPIFWFVTASAFIAAFMTPVYIGRQYFLLFFKQTPQALGDFYRHIPKASLFLSVPIVSLSIFTAFVFFSTNPFDASYGWLLNLLNQPYLLQYYPQYHTVVSFTSVLWWLAFRLLI
jgi:NADH-quinone oxidoreductase subunit L